jgi:hypothetical protein
MNEVNLDNPIFVYYINISNMPSSRIDMLCDQLSNSFSRISNVTFWIIPITDSVSHIECVYYGKNGEGFQMINNFIKKYKKEIQDNDMTDIVLLKSVLRDIVIENLGYI